MYGAQSIVMIKLSGKDRKLVKEKKFKKLWKTEKEDCLRNKSYAVGATLSLHILLNSITDRLKIKKGNIIIIIIIIFVSF